MKRLVISLLAIFILIPIIGSTQGTYVAYAVGDDNKILKLDAGQWRTVDPGIVLDCGTLLDIWGSSSEDIFVTGCGEELLHYNGFEWQKITIPDATPFYSDVFYTVDGTGPDNIYVAGQEYFGYDRVGVAYHYDGYDWNYVDGYGSIHRLWADPGGGFYSINMLVDFSQLGDPLPAIHSCPEKHLILLRLRVDSYPGGILTGMISGTASVAKSSTRMLALSGRSTSTASGVNRTTMSGSPGRMA